MARWSSTGFASSIVAGLIAARMAKTGEKGSQAKDSLVKRAVAIEGLGAPALLCEFREIEQLLGYTEDTPGEERTIQVSVQQVNINGIVVNSNVVAANVIKSSSITAANAKISDELKELLSELHPTVAALTASLPEDEAALAAQDLADLTKEATSPNPRKAFWRRAADGLLAVAGTVGTVGIPVAELVNKVITLLK